MRGTLRPKKGRPGYWELRVDAGSDPVTKRRRQISRGFRGTRKEAEKALRALAGEVAASRDASRTKVCPACLGTGRVRPGN